jgi:hypothetical protein
MPKPLVLDPDGKKKKRKKRKKRKIDYTVYLTPPIIPDDPCPHTTKPVEASTCSQCMSVVPSIIKRPPLADWWAEDDNEDLISQLTLEEFEDLALGTVTELVDEDE